MKIIIPGEPVSQKRHRHQKRGGHMFVYNPCEKEKEDTRSKLRIQVVNAMMDENAQIAKEAQDLTKGTLFEVTLTFYISIPRTDAYMDRNAKLWQLQTCVKDLDNMEKFYLDAANEILYPDDHLIVSLSSRKLYDPKPRTEITVMRKDLPELTMKEKAVCACLAPDTLSDIVTDFVYLGCVLQDSRAKEKTHKEKLSFMSDHLVDFAKKFGDELKKLKTRSSKVQDEK